MIYGLVLAIHVALSLLLIGVILLQGGRGSLCETLGGGAAQSLFGGGANSVMTKITAIGAGLFMVTCLSLAILSTARGRSLVEQLPASTDQIPLPLPQATHSVPAAPHTVQPATQHETPPTSSTSPTP